MLTTITMGAVLLGSFVSSTPGLYGSADAADQRIARQRTWGIGTAFGGGMVGIVGPVQSGSSTLPALELPSLELQLFRDNGDSIDISVPIGNMTIINAFSDITVVGASVYYNFNLGDDWVRILLGPGIGFSAAFGPGGVGASLKIPAVIGVEMLTESRAFGFKLMARPWFEVGVGGGNGGSQAAFGGGAIAEIGFSYYGTK